MFYFRRWTLLFSGHKFINFLVERILFFFLLDSKLAELFLSPLLLVLSEVVVASICPFVRQKWVVEIVLSDDAGVVALRYELVDSNGLTELVGYDSVTRFGSNQVFLLELLVDDLAKFKAVFFGISHAICEKV